MDLGRTSPAAGRDGPLDNNLSVAVRAEPLRHNMMDGSSTSPTFSQQHEQGHGKREGGMSHNPATDDQTVVGNGSKASSDTIEALNKRISELERHINHGTAAFAHEDEAQPQVIEELEKRRKMEAFLYNHRKDWEREFGPGTWSLYSSSVYLDAKATLGRQKSKRGMWDIVSQRKKYCRPNLSILESCEDDQHDVSAMMEEYDQVIDFGNRRERLRKNFEWELDRLYLDEELDRCRRDKINEAKKLEEQHAVGTALSTGDKAAEDAAAEEDAVANEDDKLFPKFAEPKLNRLQWYSFKKLADLAEEDACVVDILIGEPIIDDDLGNYRPWFGYPRHRARVPDVPKDRNTIAPMAAPGQPLLPERIRIHSAALSQILSTVLGKPMDGLDQCTVVFIRPFKALTHCEPALRDWCKALEKRFSAPRRNGDDAPAATDGAMTGPQEGLTSSHDSDSSKVPTVDKAAPQKPNLEVSDNIAGEALFKAQDSNSVADPEEKAEEEEDEEEIGDENESNDLTKSPTALEHLKCLLNFMDSDISVRQAYLNSSECRKASFSDLWYLFRPGLEVISSDGKQAYRVIKVTSAKHSVSRNWENFYFPQNRRKKKAPFSITCVYIDFDGNHLGPVRRVFDFKRFDGERDVTSLEVYPLRFHPLRRFDFSDLEWEEIQALPADQRYRQKLIRRGAKFLEVAATRHMYYAGPTLEVRDDVESQVVIDFETAFSVEDEAQQQWKPNLEPLVGGQMAEDEGDSDEDDDNCEAACCHREAVHDDSYVDEKQSSEYVTSLLPKADDMNSQPSVAIIPRPLKQLQASPGSTIISEGELAIMSYRVFGFVLRNRKWAKLDLSYLSDVHRPTKPAAVEANDDDKNTEEKQPKTAFDRLVLEPWHRKLIESLTAQHFRDKKSTTIQREEFDIVKGKGKGLIILLHGAPGVGKTTTAEGVAELFQKPLFQITCGDLGTTASEVEKALETNFSLANRWDCILLLDEADVFLAQRTREDFRRNGLVAVFLRVMEYYAGVLFLTTNRVGDFDEAFTSRIHISLYYPELNKDKTNDVFNINIDMIEKRFKEKGRKIEIDKTKIGGFATEHFYTYEQARWNGRQIRNACQTALALAEFDAHQEGRDTVVLHARYFEIVRDAYLEFSRYMHDVYRMNTAQRAKYNELRATWVDDDKHNLVATSISGTARDRKVAEFRGVPGGQRLPSHSQHSPTQPGWQNPYATAQQQHRYQYGNLSTSQPGYPDSGYRQLQTQPVPVGQTLDPAASVPIDPHQRVRDGQMGVFGPQPPQQQNPPQQLQPAQQTQHVPLTPPPLQQYQQHTQHINQRFLNQGIQAMYEGPVQQPPN